MGTIQGVEMDEKMLREWIEGKSVREIAADRLLREEDVVKSLRTSLRALDDRLAGGDDAGSD